MDTTDTNTWVPVAYKDIGVGLLIGLLTAQVLSRMRTYFSSKTTTNCPKDTEKNLQNAKHKTTKVLQPTVTTDESSQTLDFAPDYSYRQQEEQGNPGTIHLPYRGESYPVDTMLRRSQEFFEHLNKRRSVRMFSDATVPNEVIHNIVLTAGTSPSGGHKQPWSYVVVSNHEIKSEIRAIIEEEEHVNYLRRMNETWVKDCEDILDLNQMQSSWQKPYLDQAPYLIVVFKQTYGLTPSGHKIPHYYTDASVSISVGLLVAAIHNAGLVTVTSTPMNAGPRLRQLLCRPMNEKVILLLPVGLPAEGATVPDMKRKSLEEIMVHVE